MIRKPNFKLNWKYALGEITLIFIGITIAIWFQNWNEQKKDRKLEKHFYGLVISDMQATSDDITEALQSAKMRIVAGNDILHRLDPNHQDIFLLEDMTIDSASTVRFKVWGAHLSPISKHLLSLKAVQVIDTRTAGFEEITSSGKLQAIQDNELRSEIVTVYEQMEDWAESNTFFRGAMERYTASMENAGIAQQDMRPESYLIDLIDKSPTFQASIRSQMATGYEQHLTYPYMINYINEFKAKVERVLKQSK
ncbi:hypothetical protein [Roseivirga sp. E12]|uniref:hypothetical protein n=1 Tax=Roseivirga sp. E12 TaxID=2819237 RepID=UPI001ABCD899|nr:hypothetical protein [Roseivirga sp. E12]MBO3700251.1 hypothetical protein [Roseivirga sp. E12]